MAQEIFIIMGEYVEGDPNTGVVTAPKGNNGSDDKAFQIKRGKFDSISLYEVTEEELSILESGENSVELNFAIALFSAMLTLVISLITTTMSDLVKGIFIVCSVFAFIFGFYFVVKWKKNKGKVKSTFDKIRSRLKE